ncbi:MAG: hypothetical protein IJU10_01585 [Clostridia bacterium]|nr:hypothetical protein [Clostridia bacterium]
MNLKQFEAAAKDFFDSEMKSLQGIQYEIKDGSLNITNKGLSLKGHDDDIYMSISVSEMKGDIPYQVIISFIFDKLDRTLANYELINEFNATVPFYTANITNKGFFKIQWHFVVFDPEEFIRCLNRAIIRLVNMDSDDHILKRITARTV